MHLEPQIIYPGQFLLATELLDGTDFEKAVILLLDHDQKEGSYGIVVNNHSHIPLNEVFSGLPHNDWKTEPFFLGGPVDDSQVQILQLSKGLTIEPQELLPGIFMGGRVENSLTAMEEMLFSDHSRLILGYSGWGIGQLSQELSNGAWKVYSTNPLKVLNCQIDELKLSPDEFQHKFEELSA